MKELALTLAHYRVIVAMLIALCLILAMIVGLLVQLIRIELADRRRLLGTDGPGPALTGRQRLLSCLVKPT